jgi:MtrB/PioB family decaheme-associated outer membrane protein
MRILNPMILLGAIGSLAISATAGAVDTSQWKCKSCPFEDEVKTASVDVGAIVPSGATTSFGDYTGLTRDDAYLGLGGTADYRNDNGTYANLTAADLGLDNRSASARIGHDGTYRLELGYSQIPRHFFDDARTPFLGVGGSVLSLPAGFPAGTTATMPLASTLHDVDIGYKRSSLEAGLLWIFGPQWTTHLSVRHDERSGTQRLGGSFFSTSSQLPAPVDQTTDMVEASASRAGKGLQFTLAYQGSFFRNSDDALTWTNPFPPVAFPPQAPSTAPGQLALAPDNQFHQISAMAGYDFTPTIRASASVAGGRLTQNASYLAATLNPNIAVTLPANSLDGLVYTFNADVRVTADLLERLRLNASYARDVRDNRTASRAYPAVVTDMFYEPDTRTNQPFSFINDRYRFDAEYRAPHDVRASAGVDVDNRERTNQEVVTTRETTVWGKLAVRALDRVSLSAKYAHGERDPSTYGVAAWVSPPENPLLRKYYLAKRSRDKAGVRADVALGEKLSIGFGADLSEDKYKETTLGLLDGRSVSADVDVAWVVTDHLRAHAFAQGERTRSHQAGSQLYAAPDWWARIEDVVDVAGAGVNQTLLKGKLELSADFTRTRSTTNVWMDVLTVTPQFPEVFTKLDSLKLQAAYRFKPKFSLIASYWYERYSANDWHYEYVAPDTVPNLLLFGNILPRYRVNVYALTLRCTL